MLSSLAIAKLLLGATPFAQPSDVIHSPGFCLSRYLHPSFSLFFDPSLLSSGSVFPPSSVPPCYSPSPLSLSLCRRCSRRTQAARRRARTWSCGEGGEGRRDRRRLTRAACSPRANGQRPRGRSALPHAAAHAGPLAYRAAQQLQASRASAAALASAQCALSLLTVSPCTCLCGRASGPAAGGTCGVNRGRRRASSPPDAAAVLFLKRSGAPPPALRRASTTSSCLLRITI